MIAGLERPAAGEIAIDGQPVDGPGENRVLMFQDAGLFPWLNVLDNVLFGLRMQRQPKDVALAHAMNCLRLVQLSRFARSAAHTSCPAGCGSEWRWRGRWRCGPACC